MNIELRSQKLYLSCNRWCIFCQRSNFNYWFPAIVIHTINFPACTWNYCAMEISPKPPSEIACMITSYSTLYQVLSFCIQMNLRIGLSIFLMLLSLPTHRHIVSHMLDKIKWFANMILAMSVFGSFEDFSILSCSVSNRYLIAWYFDSWLPMKIPRYLDSFSYVSHIHCIWSKNLVMGPFDKCLKLCFCQLQCRPDATLNVSKMLWHLSIIASSTLRISLIFSARSYECYGFWYLESLPFWLCLLPSLIPSLG